MKGTINRLIIISIITLLITCSGMVYATYAIFSGDVVYRKSNSSININNVKDALDYLYNLSDDVVINNNASSIIYEYDYSNSENIFIVPLSGVYKLEVWGAQGGSNTKSNTVSTVAIGGYGGYSIGNVSLSKNDILFINVGGKGSNNTNATGGSGGYNGGGTGGNAVAQSLNGGCGGGGATHIATVSGELSELSQYKDTYSQNSSNEILIVAGGGGGAGNESTQGNAGGFKSTQVDSTGCLKNNQPTLIQSSTQSDGFMFGLGQNGKTTITSYCNGGEAAGGGGGGYYGGRAYQTDSINSALAGVGGSGNISSSKLISSGQTVKHMTCYNCETSSDANTKTESNDCHDTNPTMDCAKEGNGYVRITYIS